MREPTRRPSVLIPLFLLVSLPLIAPASRAAEPEGRVEAELLEIRYYPEGRHDDDRDEELAQLLRVAAHRARLESEGRRLATQAAGGPVPAEPRFSWPLADVRSGQFSPWAISNFVDQDPQWPNAVEDYNCGERTYDTSDGYNHTGIDIFVWPFPWRQKARGTVAVVAAAPGQIIDWRDGFPDDSCSLSGGTSNTVVLEHPDGSASFYRHLKNGSVTPKQIGDTVVRGEYLGLVASSGNSTGPHLHFAARNADEDLIEPYAGFCNAQANGMTSWWLDQPPYRDYQIVDIATHSAAPTNPPCPEVENPNFKRLWSPGQTARVGLYFRDTTASASSEVTVTRANGSVHTDWLVDHAQAANAVAHYWQFALPDVLLPAWRGPWKVQARWWDDGLLFVRERTFWVGAIFADDFERVSLSDAGWILPLPPPPPPIP